MTTILYPPYTKEDILKAKITELEKENEKYKKKSDNLEFQNSKMMEKIDFLNSCIEQARIYGIREMLGCLKSGKITNKYQGV